MLKYLHLTSEKLQNATMHSQKHIPLHVKCFAKGNTRNEEFSRSQTLKFHHNYVHYVWEVHDVGREREREREREGKMREKRERERDSLLRQMVESGGFY